MSKPPVNHTRFGSRRPERKSAVTTWQKTTPQAAGSAGKAAKRSKSNSEGRVRNKVGSSPAGLWKNLRRLHAQMAGDALRRMLATPMASLMTVLVLGIALSLPAALSMTLDNLRVVAGNSAATSARIALYLDSHTDDAQAVRMREELVGDKAVAKAIYISPAQGLEEFAQYSGVGNALRLLDSNPLPGVIEVEPVDTSPLAVSNLQNRLVRMGGVEEVRVDSEWLGRLNAILTLGDRVLKGLSVLIGVAVLLAVGNTIRLLVVNRSDEIRVIKLVGGSDGFVILPFLYSGFWYGLAGGILAWLIIVGLWLMVSGPAGQLAVLYQSTIRLGFPSLNMTMLLVCGSALMGIVGALLASWRQLRDIDP